MKIPCPCRSCGYENEAELAQVGRQLRCGCCAATVTVYPPMETVGGSVGTAPVGKFACPACGRKYATKAELAGQKIRCGGCGAGVRVPGAGGATDSRASRPALKTFGADAPASPARERPRPVLAQAGGGGGAGPPDALLDELASIEGVKAPKRAGAALPSRAEVMEQVRRKAAERPPAGNSPAATG